MPTIKSVSVKTLIVSLFYLAAITTANFFGHSGSEVSAKEPEEKVLCPPSPESSAIGRAQALVIKGDISPGLTDTETRLVCGDFASADPLSQPWKNVPSNQAKFSLNTFLQDRGRFRPTYIQTPGKITVDIGPPAIVSSVRTEGAPPALKIERKRKVVGELLTPTLLSELEQWVVSRLQAEGYGCPKVKSEADPETGEVIVHVDPGQPQDIVSIFEENISGVLPGMLRRYDAFRLGKRFNGDNLSLTERRILSQDLVLSTHLAISCEPEGIRLRHENVAGPPRLVTLGAGVDTEGLIRLRASWVNARLGHNASNASVVADTSSKVQTLQGQVTWYHLPFPSRRYLKPLAEFKHQNEEWYEIVSPHLSISEGTSWDNESLGLSFRVGPAYDLIHILEGTGQPTTRFVSLEAEARAMSHYFEYFRSSPRTGYNVTLSTDFSSKQVLSDASAQRVRLTAEGLLNYREYDPPLFIFGIRTGLMSTLGGESLGPNTPIPPTFRYFLGGSQDLRGFGRQELPGNPDGGLSAAFASLETRVSSVLPYKLQPFVFVDVGKLGTRAATLDSPLYWSPGVGIRWESPVGAIRTTLGHGYVAGQPATSLSHLQFFFSFGEEF